MVPIEHCDAMATAPEQLQAEARRFLSALGAMFASQGKGMVVFERVLQATREGQRPAHTHYQVVSLPADVAAKAKETFLTEGSFRYVPLTELGEGDTLAGALGLADGGDATAAAAAAAAVGNGAPRGKEYFYAEVSVGAPPLPVGGDSGAGGAAPASRPPFARLLHIVPPGAKHPVQFGREVLCRLLSLPDRLTWKSCVESTEVETTMTEAFRAAFAPFDFTSEL